MTSIALRPTVDVVRGLEEIAALPIVTDAYTDSEGTGDGWARVGVVELEPGIDRVPPSVCRLIAEQDFGIARVERYGDVLEVVLR